MALQDMRVDAHLVRSVGYSICNQFAGGGDWCAGEDDVVCVTHF
jgi:hypothetical protein